jgi:UDPglucose 6-dehydrogenase
MLASFKDLEKMKISIFGSGYVGLVTGICFAEQGNEVICVDIDKDKIKSLQSGVIPIYEPGLEGLLSNNLKNDRIHFSGSIQEGVDFSDLIFIAVGTPSDEDGSADLQYVLSVAKSIGQYMSSDKLIVNKSTVPVGTADRVASTIRSELSMRNSPLNFQVASNPEFLKEGAAVEDFMKPDRIVIGTEDVNSIEVFQTLYAPFNRNHDKMVFMDARSAELTKYAANVMLAARISLMNELANMADQLDADIESVRKGIGSDPRIGPNFLYAGTGYGGSCFPKDVKALIHIANNIGVKASIVESVEEVNAKQKTVLFDKLNKHFQGNLSGKIISLWGLAFKPNTDDMREAPSRTLIDKLIASGAIVHAYDPQAADEARRLYPEEHALKIFASAGEALEGSSALIVVTEWNEFRSPDFEEIKKKLKEALILDGRNLYDPLFLENLGFTYYGIGRGK